jgi:hypothetical protein
MLNEAIPVKTAAWRGQSLEAEAASALRACLAGLPGHRVSIRDDAGALRDTGADLTAHVTWQGGERELVAQVKASIYPQTARLATAQLRAMVAQRPGAYPVLMGPYVSPAVAELCAAEGVGYVDLAGNCRLTFDGIFIERSGQPNPAARKDQLKSLFAPQAQRVLRVLLVHSRRRWRLAELAQEAGVSVGHVHNVKKLLVAHEWAENRRQGLTLTKPGALLDAWAERGQPRAAVVQAFALGEVSELEAAVAEACEGAGVPYALTEFSAAIRYAPMVRYVRAAAYVLGDAEPLMATLGAKEVDSGANVRLIVPRDDGVLYGSQAIDGVALVAPPQAYLDLVALPGRGEEAAAAVREKVMEPQW